MSFLASLLRRELPPASSAERASADTTSAPAVVPRLASRFEHPGTPWWPGSGEQGSSDDRHDGPDLEQLEERDAKAGPRTGTHAGDALMTGNPARPSEHQDGAAGPDKALRLRTGRPGIAGEASALHSGIADGNTHKGEETSTVRPAAAAALPSPTPPPAVFSAAERLGAATASKAPLFAPDTAEDGVGRPGRASGVVHGLERTRESNPAAHSHGDGREAWQGSSDGQVRPRLEPLARREATMAPEQHIHVSIGRIEVRAVAAAAPQHPTSGRAGLMSLDEYLRDRP